METLKLKQDTAVQSATQDSKELFLISGSKHYLHVIDLRLLKQNIYYIHCLLPLIDLFKELHNIFFFKDSQINKKVKTLGFSIAMWIIHTSYYSKYYDNQEMTTYILIQKWKILFKYEILSFIKHKKILIDSVEQRKLMDFCSS